MENIKPLLQTFNCYIGYPGKKEICVAGPLNLQLYPGRLVCLLGPNGAGKSTLLRTVAGLQPALKGNIQLGEDDISSLLPLAIAKQISLVLTDAVRTSNLDVYSLVALGRYPYSGWLRLLTPHDKDVIARAIASTGTGAFLSRKIDTLSDGELQKVMLARALAQSTPIIILDEPTAHLDLPSRIHLMKLLHQLAKESNKAILISTHDLDLALQVADDVWLMAQTGITTGAPEDMILNGSFTAVFDRDGILFDKATGTFKIHQPQGKIISLNGNGVAAFWTGRALNRAGFDIVPCAANNADLTVTDDGELTNWTTNINGRQEVHTSLASVLRALT